MSRIRELLTSSRSRKALLLDVGIVVGTLVFALSAVGASSAAASLTPTSGLGTAGPGPAIPSSAAPVTKLWTANSRTYREPDGPYTTILYVLPVNAKGPEGAWKPIEGTTIPGEPATPSGASAPRIDASVKLGASQDCSLISNKPTERSCSATSDKVGWDGVDTDNTLIQFNIKAALPPDTNVLNAQLGMHLSGSSTSKAVSVSTYALLKPWTTSATWNTYDGTNAWAEAGAEKAGIDYTTTNTVLNPSVVAPAGWAHWYPTQIVQEWANGTLENHGLVLGDTTQRNTNDALTFNSSRASSNKPYLTISWMPRGQEDPTAYTMQAFSIDESSTMKVNLGSGNLFVNSTDLSLAGTGPPLLIEHNFDSRNTEGGSVNPWTSLPSAGPYADGSLTLSLNGYDYPTFIRQSDGTFLTPRGIDATLCKVNGTTCTANKADTNGATYALIFNHDGNGPMYKAGNKFTFSETGGPLSDADTSGNAIVFHWGKKGLESITNTAGSTFTRTFYKLKSGFEVTSTWTDVAGKREVKYAYNSGDKLETYTDAEGHQTKYAYNTEGELSEITAPSGTVTKLYYTTDKSRRVAKIEGAESNGSNGTWEYTYYEAGKAPAPCTATQKAVAATSPERGGLYCANPFDEVEQVRELKPPVFSGFEVSAYDESATSPTVLYFSEAEDPLLPDGSPGPGVATYSYRYSVNEGPFSSWAQTEFAEAETPHIPVGATVVIQVYAVDNAGNVSQVVTASTVVAEEEAESVTAREEWEAELAEIEAETEAPPETYIAGPEYLEEGEYGGSPAFTGDVNRTDRLTPKPARPPAALHAAPYLNSKFRGGQWTCRGSYDVISNEASGVAIGNCKGGWILNSQRLSDPNLQGIRYAGGYIGGSYNGCGWLNASAAGERDPTTYSACANPTVGYGRFGVVFNSKHTEEGTSIAVATKTCTAYANFRPFSRHYGPANKVASNVPKGTILKWRYVAGVGGTHRGYEHANGDLWVMVLNTKPSTSGGVSWVFVPYHGCFGASPRLPAGPGGYWHP